MKILSSFTHPQVVPNLYLFLSSAEHKIFWVICTWVNEWWPLTVLYFFPHTLEVSGYQQLFGYQHSSKCHLIFQQNKEIHTDLEQLEGAWVNDSRIDIFGWTIPSSISCPRCVSMESLKGSYATCTFTSCLNWNVCWQCVYTITL